MTDLVTRIAALEAELAKPPAFIYNADGHEGSPGPGTTQPHPRGA